MLFWKLESKKNIVQPDMFDLKLAKIQIQAGKETPSEFGGIHSFAVSTELTLLLKLF